MSSTAKSLEYEAALAERECSEAWSMVRDDARFYGRAKRWCAATARFLSSADLELNQSMLTNATDWLRCSLKDWRGKRDRFLALRARLNTSPIHYERITS